MVPPDVVVDVVACSACNAKLFVGIWITITPPTRLRFAIRCTSTRIVFTACAGVLVLAVPMAAGTFVVAVAVITPPALASVNGV